MSNICTNIQQSEKLVRLGLDPTTSDMWWIDDQLVAKSDKFDVPSNDEETTVHCAWSLSALLEVMKEHCPELLFLEAYWYCRCMQVESEYCDDPITAVYDVLCWLLERGLIKKGGQDGM